ncbi:MAG: hypothetical protein L6R41_007524 [Letrouitia leprolyta]|nr:MAG: hypothetical protein L6R41_007524 [Letrouitia leprolyta]
MDAKGKTPTPNSEKRDFGVIDSDLVRRVTQGHGISGFVPPQEIELSHGISSTAYADSGLNTHKGSSSASRRSDSEECPQNGEILKTVEMESTATVVQAV